MNKEVEVKKKDQSNVTFRFRKLKMIQWTPVLVTIALIVIYHKSLVFNLVGILLITLYFFGFFTNYLSIPFTILTDKTENSIDDRFDNHCILGLLNSTLLFGGTYLLFSAVESSASHIFIFIFIFILYQIVDAITKALLCVDNTSTPCFSVGLFSKVFCYVSNTNAIKNDNNKKQNKPLHALVISLRILLSLLFLLAVLTFVFDYPLSTTILQSGGLVALIVSYIFKSQLNSILIGAKLFLRDGFQIGDWLEIPELKSSGSIIEITLSSIIVKNSDNTISNIPIETFSSKIYKNWGYLKKYGGRRIKRSLWIDQTTVYKLTEEDIEYYKQIELLETYIKDKQKEIENHNKNNKRKRYLTNLGVFRIYIEKYLEALQNEDVLQKDGVTTLVRQLSPNAYGIPLEIYAFTKDTTWMEYEYVQSDIMDFLLAGVDTFKLKVFQVN
jgi:miniconductance mechanosensitive channel